MVSSSLLSRSTLSSNCTDMLLRRTRSLSSHSSNNLYSVRFLSTNGGVTVQQFCSVMRESNRKASGLDRFTTIPQKHCEEPAKTNIKRGPRHKQHQVPRGGSTRMSSRREGKRFHGYLLRCFEQRPPTTENRSDVEKTAVIPITSYFQKPLDHRWQLFGRKHLQGKTACFGSMPTVQPHFCSHQPSSWANYH